MEKVFLKYACEGVGYEEKFIDMEYMMGYDPCSRWYRPIKTWNDLLFCQYANYPIVVLKEKQKKAIRASKLDENLIRFTINPRHILIIRPAKDVGHQEP